MARASILAALLAATSTMAPLASVRAAGLAEAGYSASSWHTRDGLPFEWVHALAQAPDQYLWVATDFGVARFDGARFETFDSASTQALSPDAVHALLAAKDGTLWVGTWGGGVARFDGADWRRWRLGGESGRELVTSLAQRPGGGLWVGTSAGLLAWRPDASAEPAVELRDAVARVVTTSLGESWALLAAGTLRRRQGGSWPPVELPAPLGAPLALAADPAGGVLVGAEGGIGRQAGRGWELLRGRDDGPRNVQALVRDGSGSLWAASRRDVWRLDATGWQRLHEAPRFVSDLTLDRDGNVWLATLGGGVQRLRRTPVVAQAAPGAGDVYSVATDPEGALLVGAAGGLFRRAKGSAGFERTGEATEVTALHRDRRGTLWVGTLGSLLSWDAAGWHTHAPTGVRDLEELPETGGFLLATMRGLATWHPGEAHPSPLRGPVAPVTFLERDRRGRTWIGTYGSGLYLLREDGRRPSLRKVLDAAIVLCAREDEAGRVWVGTGEGLYVLDGDGRPGRRAREADGLYGEAVAELFLDAQARLWIYSRKGLYWVDRRELLALVAGKRSRVTSRLVGPSEGMVDELPWPLPNPRVARTADGRFWVPARSVLLSIDPGAARPSPPKAVTFEEVTVDGRPAWRGGAAKPLALAPGWRRLNFRFTAVDLSSPERLRFRARLRGYEEWRELGRARAVEYSRVPPGSYSFEVAALDGDLPLSVASLPVEAKPFLHQTLGFRLAAGLIVAAAGFALLRWRVRVVHRRARLEGLVHEARLERLRHQLRPHFLFNALHGISSLLHEDPGAARRMIAQLADLLRSSLDIGGSDEITVAEEVELVRRYLALQGLRFEERLRVDVDVDAGAAEALLPAFLIQTLVENAIRHGVERQPATGEVLLHVKAEGGRLWIRVRDNGPGFAPGAPGRETGLGLSNLRERLRVLYGEGSEMNVRNLPGAGAEVEVILPLTRLAAVG
jgi:ligand-binding sensor domain-containing protein/signal transduction histidine kinase